MKEQIEKQAIEEMAALMDGACDVKPLEECYTVDCNKCKAALLYNASYRKQSVGKWVWADDGYCRCSVCTQKAPVTTQYQDEPMTTATKYCPNCGARMKGGAE